MAIFDPPTTEEKPSMTPQARRGWILLVTGLLLTSITLLFHGRLPPVILDGKDWSEFLRGVVMGVAVVLELVGMVLLIRATFFVRSKS